MQKHYLGEMFKAGDTVYKTYRDDCCDRCDFNDMNFIFCYEHSCIDNKGKHLIFKEIKKSLLSKINDKIQGWRK